MYNSGREVLFYKTTQTDSVAHPDIQWGSRFFPGGETAGA